jgi:DNA-binding GntR family transcriptional regulator
LTGADFARLEGLIRRMEKLARQGDTIAMAEADVEFHRVIVTRADHLLLLNTWERINPSQWTYITVRMLAERGTTYIAVRHWPLLEALRGDSSEAAEAAMVDHIDTIGAEALEIFTSMRGVPRTPSTRSRTTK